ncbi:ATP-binding protein [Pseudorhodoferax sp. LjRoot39]|uniref:ATP-binding protein n=1 Tax=Pseudorhodoferax sp. LjRoot39 TaxID=3342328 RepID=UPI003ECE54DC
MTAVALDPRVSSFRSKLVKHATIEHALTQLIRAVTQPRPESVIVLTGPSGVGKSTIIGAVEKHLRNVHAQRMADDPGMLPYISLRAPTPLDGHFNWKDAFTRALHIAGEVLIDRKVLPRFEMSLDGRKIDSTKGLVREELRRSLESLVRHRKVPVIILDEASALLRLKRGALPFLQFEILKSLAVELRIPIVLVGAYDLLGILEGTGQLLRRSLVVHCPRYQESQTLGGIDPNFVDVLHALLAAIDCPQEPGLADHFDFFYMKSLGCVGVLKDWLDRAFVAALAASPEEPLLTREIIEAEALPNRQIKRLAQEAKVGELKMVEVDDADVAKELNLAYTPSMHMPAPEFEIAVRPPVKKRVGRAGMRGPSRDQVGAPHA